MREDQHLWALFVSALPATLLFADGEHSSPACASVALQRNASQGVCTNHPLPVLASAALRQVVLTLELAVHFHGLDCHPLAG